MPQSRANSSVEGSGTAAGLPLKLAVEANSAADPLVPVPTALVSAASKSEPVSASGAASVAGKIDEDGNAANTRLSNRLTSRPGSVVASRSIAAMRFSSCWPLTLVIEPAAIASWMAASGSPVPSDEAALGAAEAGVAEAAATTPPPAPAEGAIVTVEPALIVNVFCRICVAVRLAALVPSPTVVLPAYTWAPSAFVVGSLVIAPIDSVVPPANTTAPSLAVPLPLVLMFAVLGRAWVVPANCSVPPMPTVIDVLAMLAPASISNVPLLTCVGPV